MSLARIDLNLFVVFDAIYTQGSLTRAAEVLHVTQPAVSNSLARLRSLLDDPLFVRSPKGMVPTPLAQQIVGPLRDALRNIDTCVQARLQFDPATASNTFRLNATEHAELLLLPKLVTALEQAAPGVRLEVSFTDRHEVPLEMAAGNLHLSVDAPLLSHPELLSAPLIRDEYVCVMRRDHPLARGRLTLERYLAARHLHVSSRLRGAGHVDLALRSLGHRREVTLRLQHNFAAPNIIAGSDFLLSVPQSLARQWDLLCKPLPFETPPLELHLYWHRGVDHDPANQWLRERVAGLVRNEKR